jgi:hypothetical protein
MRRREFIAGLGSSATAWPLVARAQQPTLPVIGFLHSDFPGRLTDRLRYFRQGLSEMGYVEGRNVAIEYRGAEDEFDRLPALAADLIRRRAAVIVAGSFLAQRTRSYFRKSSSPALVAPSLRVRIRSTTPRIQYEPPIPKSTTPTGVRRQLAIRRIRLQVVATLRLKDAGVGTTALANP